MATEPRREKREARKDLAEQYNAVQKAAQPEKVPDTRLPQKTNPITADDVFQAQQMARSYRLMKASTVLDTLSRAVSGVSDAALGNMSVVQAGRYIATGDELTEREKHALRLQYLALLASMAQGDYLAEKLAVDYATDKYATQQKFLRASTDLLAAALRYSADTQASNVDQRNANLEFLDKQAKDAEETIEQHKSAELQQELSTTGKEIFAQASAIRSNTQDKAEQQRQLFKLFSKPGIPPQDVKYLYEEFLLPESIDPNQPFEAFMADLVSKDPTRAFPSEITNEDAFRDFQRVARESLVKQASNERRVEEARKELENYQRQIGQFSGYVGGNFDPTILTTLANNQAMAMIGQLEDLNTHEALAMAIGTSLGFPQEEVIASVEATQTPQGQQAINETFKKATGFDSYRALFDDMKTNAPEEYKAMLDQFKVDAQLPDTSNVESVFDRAVTHIDAPRYTPPSQLTEASQSKRAPSEGSAAARKQVKDEVTKQLQEIEHPGQSHLEEARNLIMATPEFDRWMMTTGYQDPQEAFKEFIKTNAIGARKFRQANRDTYLDQTRASRAQERATPKNTGKKTIDDILVSGGYIDLDDLPDRPHKKQSPPVGGADSPDSGTLSVDPEEEDDEFILRPAVPGDPGMHTLPGSIWDSLEEDE